MYEVTWQQSGDGSSLRNATTTETSYTIEGLTPGTSYKIRVGAYCKENPSIKSQSIQSMHRNCVAITTQLYIWLTSFIPPLMLAYNCNKHLDIIHFEF